MESRSTRYCSYCDQSYNLTFDKFQRHYNECRLKNVERPKNIFSVDKCSRSFSGKRYVKQETFVCETCFPRMGGKSFYFCVCRACAFTCHAGHNGVYYQGISNGFCDCPDCETSPCTIFDGDPDEIRDRGTFEQLKIENVDLENLDLNPEIDATQLVPETMLDSVRLYQCVFCYVSLDACELVCSPSAKLSTLGAPYACCMNCFSKIDNSALQKAKFFHLTGLTNHRALYESFAWRIMNRFRVYAANQCIGEIDAKTGRFQYVSYAEVYDSARKLSSAILGLTEEVSGVICLRCENSAAWIISDMAMIFSGFTVAPIATSVAPMAMGAIIEHTDAKVVLCSAKELFSVAKALKSKKTMVQFVLVLGDQEHNKDAVALIEEEKVRVVGWKEALEIGKEWKAVNRSMNPKTDVRTLIFTSGSTGVPKGVMISDQQMSEEFDKAEMYQRFTAHFCFEPLPLAACRINTWVVLMNGGRVDMFSGNFNEFFNELRLSSPHWFSAAPRIWNWMYSIFKGRVQTLIREGNDEAKAREIAGEEARDMIGSRCELVQTGSALTALEVFEWMQKTFKRMAVYDGYGTTEAGGISVNHRVSFECTVHLTSCPELGYTVEDKPLPRGLLWVHTPQVALGYYKRKDQTDENFQKILGDDRMFFNTGDIVTYDKSKQQIFVIDRAKNLFKLAQGVYVSPEALEGLYLASVYTEQVYIYAEPDKEFVLCVVVPTLSNLEAAVFEKHNVKFNSHELLCKSPLAENIVLQDLQKVAKEKGISSYEVPRSVILESVRWSPNGGTLTPSFKTNRIGLRAKYASRLSVRYKQLNGDLITSSDLIDLTSSQILDVRSENGGVSHSDDLVNSTDLVYSRENSFFLLIKKITGFEYKSNLNTKVTEVGLDSVGFVYLQNQIEQKLGVSVPFTLLYECDFAELERYVMKSSGDDSTTGAAVDWEREISMDGYDLHQTQEQKKKEVKNVFLTGANGFFGVYLLRELVQRGYSVHCLIRGNGSEKLKQSLDFHQLDIDMNKVKIISGDLSKKMFGLSLERFNELANEVDMVIHNGCYVNGIFPYSLLKQVNVESTKDCISLCSIRNLKLIFISSLSSLQPGEEDENIQLGINGFVNSMSGYGQSKRVSEIVIQKYYKNHLIVRPGTIGSSCVTGSSNLNDTITKLFIGMIELKKAPILKDEIITVIPVDCASRIVCDNMTTDRLNLNLFGEKIQMEEIIAKINESFLLQRLPFKHFVEDVLLLGEEYTLTPLKSYFKNYQLPLQDDGKFARRSGYKCKDVDITLWMKFLKSKKVI